MADWITVSVTVVDVKPATPVAIRNEWVQVSTQMGSDEFSWIMTEWEPTNEAGIATFYLDANRWGENTIMADVGIGGYSSYKPEQEEVLITGSEGTARIETRPVSYTLSGTITDENDSPLANREICMFYHHPNTQKRIDFDFTTDSEGKYEIQGVGHNWINFEPIACGYYDDFLTYDWFNGYDVNNIDSVNSTAELDVQFTKTGIEVEVVDENGDPAAFVQLGLDEVDPEEGWQDYRRQAVTNQEGIAYFSSLDPNSAFELSYRSQDRPWEAARYQDSASTQIVTTGGRNSITQADLVLQRSPDFPETPVTVSGKVLGVGNAPIANATVQINANFGIHGSNYIGFRARTNQAGDFSVSGLPYGYIGLEISAKGHRSVRQDFEATELKGASYNQGSYRLRASTVGEYEYAGTLRDNTGAPIAEMELVLHNPFESGRGVHKVETDAQGRFSFTGLNEGHHWMYANSNWEDYEWSSWGFYLTSSRPSVSLVIYKRGAGIVGPQATISGRVIEYLDVQGIDSAVGVENICVDVYPVEGGNMSRGTTDADGYWTAPGLVEGEDYYIGTPATCPGDQSPGQRFDFQNGYEWPQPSEYVVTAREAGGTPHLWTYKEVSRSGTGSISGRVKDADTYRNLADITINIERANGGIVIDPVTTDSRGEYEFSNLPAGEYYLNISGVAIGEDSYWDTWLSVEVTTEPNRANILLYRQASESEGWGDWISTLIGTVFDELGNPHGLAKVEVYDPFLEYTVGYGETDNDGKFEISNLPSETNLQLKIFPWWTEIAVYFIEFVIDKSNQKDMGDIDLVAGNAILGEVAKIPQGVEVRKIFAELVDAETGAFIIASEVDSETGQYRIGQVPDGDYKVRFTQNSKGNVWSEFAQDSVSMNPVYWNNTIFGTSDITQASVISVAAGQVVPAKNITFSDGSIIQGNVSIDSPSGPIPLSGNRFIWVNLWKLGSNGIWNYHSWAEVSANSKYRYQFVGLSAGDYKIEFIDSRTGSNALTSNYNGGAATLEEAPAITLGSAQRLQANHLMSIAPPQKSAAAFDLDDLGEARLAELKDQISLAASALPGSEIEVFVGTEFTGEFISAFANSTPVLLGDWKQVDSRGYISVSLPSNLPAGSHRIATQDSRGIVFGWAPITITGPDAGTIKGPDVAEVSPSAQKAKARTSMSVVEAEPEESVKQPAATEEVAAAPAIIESSNDDWLLPLAGGFLLLAAVGSAWALRMRRVGVHSK